MPEDKQFRVSWAGAVRPKYSAWLGDDAHRLWDENKPFTIHAKDLAAAKTFLIDEHRLEPAYLSVVEVDASASTLRFTAIVINDGYHDRTEYMHLEAQNPDAAKMEADRRFGSAWRTFAVLCGHVIPSCYGLRWTPPPDEHSHTNDIPY